MEKYVNIKLEEAMYSVLYAGQYTNVEAINAAEAALIIFDELEAKGIDTDGESLTVYCYYMKDGSLELSNWPLKFDKELAKKEVNKLMMANLKMLRAPRLKEVLKNEQRYLKARYRALECEREEAVEDGSVASSVIEDMMEELKEAEATIKQKEAEMAEVKARIEAIDRML